jgi:hypothetical protein
MRGEEIRRILRLQLLTVYLVLALNSNAIRISYFEIKAISVRTKKTGFLGGEKNDQGYL